MKNDIYGSSLLIGIKNNFSVEK